MKKKTSVEWLIEQLGIEEIISDCKKEYRDRYIEKIQQAKQMHKQEIIESYNEGVKAGVHDYMCTEYGDDNQLVSAKQYYKNTYEKE